MHAHKWKRGAEEKASTVKEIHRKATQIGPAYNKGALQYLPSAGVPDAPGNASTTRTSWSRAATSQRPLRNFTMTLKAANDRKRPCALRCQRRDTDALSQTKALPPEPERGVGCFGIVVTSALTEQ